MLVEGQSKTQVAAAFGVRRETADKWAARSAGHGHRIPGDRTGQSNHPEEFVHACIDDASRRAFAEIMPNEKHANAVTNLLLHHGEQRIGWIKRAGSQAPLSD